MRKRHTFGVRPAIVLFVLAVGLCALGAGYAAWTDVLTVRGGLTTGDMNIVFDSSVPITVQLVSGKGTEGYQPAYDGEYGDSIGGGTYSQEIVVDYEVDNSGRYASIVFASPFYIEDLTNPNNMLMMRYGLKFSADSSVTAVETYSADFSVPSSEQITLTPGTVRMMSGGMEYPLPEGYGYLSASVIMDVYRELKSENGLLIATVYLKPSRDNYMLAGYGENELWLEADTLPLELYDMFAPISSTTGEVFSSIETVADYSFSVPIYVGQAGGAESGR